MGKVGSRVVFFVWKLCVEIWFGLNYWEYILVLGSGCLFYGGYFFGFWGGSKVYLRLLKSGFYGNCGVLLSRYWGVCMLWRDIDLGWLF